MNYSNITNSYTDEQKNSHYKKDVSSLLDLEPIYILSLDGIYEWVLRGGKKWMK